MREEMESEIEREKNKIDNVIKLLEIVRNKLREVMIRKEDVPKLKTLIKQIWLEVDPQDLEVVSILEKTTDMKEVCRPAGVVSSMLLKHGDQVEVIVKGRYEKMIKGRFKCVNATYGDVVLETEEGEEISIRVQHIKMVKKRTRR